MIQQYYQSHHCRGCIPKGGRHNWRNQFHTNHSSPFHQRILHEKVRFTDMEPDAGPLLFNARDSMYMRAELQRELDFGIPAQEEAHRYARWCIEEAKREAAESAEAEAKSNYAKADIVVHPKRISTDLSAMDIDLSNLGEDVSGLDVFSRVEATLEKQQKEKRKQKEERRKKDSSREKLKEMLLTSPKRGNSHSSISSTEEASAPVKEKKGSKFLRKVISDRVMKPREGSSNTSPDNPLDDARAKEIAEFFGKMVKQPQSADSSIAPNISGTSRQESPISISSIESARNTSPEVNRKPVESPPSPERNAVSQGPQLHHPKPRPLHSLQPPPLVNSQQQPPSPPGSSHEQLASSHPHPHTNIRTIPSGGDTRQRQHGTAGNNPRAPSNSARWNASQSSRSPSPNPNGRRPSLPTQNPARAPPPSLSHSKSVHHPNGRGGNSPAHLTPLAITPNASRTPSPSRQPASDSVPQSSAQRQTPQPSSRPSTQHGAASPQVHPLPPASSPHAGPLKQAPPRSAPSAPHARPPSQPALPVDDVFSRIEQDIARTQLNIKQDERHRGRKLLGKALGHMGRSGEKIKEKMEKEKR
ncbi:hypothetical protein BDZ91DRAFT_118333 [Kalaharituber pfeilii]|nr:hypothetical protein BDZ91DRAFT_118333 [Kalaharituber pfeilii]